MSLFGLLQDTVSNLSSNMSVMINGIAQGQPIPITISQTLNPYQFWVTTGVSLLVGGGILVIPLLSMSSPIKKGKAIKAFSKLTGRPTLVIDNAKQSLFKQSMIDRKTVSYMINNMNKLNGADFNLVLNTGGGECFSAELISSAMKKYKGQIHVYVPKYSMSAGTLLTLSANHIHLNEYSSLGPLDVQVGGIMSQGSTEAWKKVVALKKEKANDNSIIHAMTGEMVTKDMRENIYNLIKNKTSRVTETINYLTAGDKSHIHQIKKDKMLELGFNNIYNISNNEQRLLCQMVD